MATVIDTVLIPEITEEQKPWFISFVKWFRTNNGAKLDPDNLCKVQPVNETEAIFLNFLKFFDKYIVKHWTRKKKSKERSEGGKEQKRGKHHFCWSSHHHIFTQLLYLQWHL